MSSKHKFYILEIFLIINKQKIKQNIKISHCAIAVMVEKSTFGHYFSIIYFNDISSQNENGIKGKRIISYIKNGKQIYGTVEQLTFSIGMPHF